MSLSQSATSQWGLGFHTLRGGIDQEISVFVPGLLELKNCGRMSNAGMTIYLPRGVLAL